MISCAKDVERNSLADFLALQLVLTARSGAPLRLMGHFAWPTHFLDPRGPRALPFISVRLDSLCTSTSPFPPDCLDYSARAHSLSTQSARCQSLPEYLLQIHESLSLFSYLTKCFIFAFDT